MGAATTVPMNGMRDFTNPGAAYQVRYPEAWTITAQDESMNISPGDRSEPRDRFSDRPSAQLEAIR